MTTHPVLTDDHGLNTRDRHLVAKTEGAKMLLAAEKASGFNDKAGVDQILDRPRTNKYGPYLYGRMLIERGQAKWDRGDVEGAHREFCLISRTALATFDDLAARVSLHRTNVQRREAHRLFKQGDVKGASKVCESAINEASHAAACAHAGANQLLEADCRLTRIYTCGLKALVEGAGTDVFNALLVEATLAVNARDDATGRGLPLGIFGPTCLVDLSLRSACPMPAMLGDLVRHDQAQHQAFLSVFGSPTPGAYVDWLLERTLAHFQSDLCRPLSVARAVAFIAERLGQTDFNRAMKVQLALVELASTHQRYRDRIRESIGYEVPMLPGVNVALGKVRRITGFPPNMRMFR